MGQILRDGLKKRRKKKDKMMEVTFKIPLVQSTTSVQLDATTGGPIVIPLGFPDIAWISTTTLAAQLILHQPILIGTTNVATKFYNAPHNYTARSFNLKIVRELTVGDRITLKYRPVGDLVRT